MNSLICDFVEPENVDVPDKAVVWTNLLYCDMSGWYSLPNSEKLELKMTRFSDNRLMFLDPLSSTPPDIQSMVSGEYDVRCWGKDENFVCIEAEKSVYIKIRNNKKVVTYHHPDRLPTLIKAWKPILFLINASVCTLRLTEDLALILSWNDKLGPNVYVYALDYNKGFCCSHPTANYGIAYGSYIVKHLFNCVELPYMPGIRGAWGFFVQFYSWGGFMLPKEVDYATPNNSITSIISLHKTDQIGILFHPPNIFLYVHLDGPKKINRKLIYGKDFNMTAKKESDSDINIYLLIDGQLAVYNYSFDIRINKAGGSKVNQHIKFKAVRFDANDKVSNKLSIKAEKEVRIAIQSGSPAGTEMGHFLSEQVIAVFDAETCKYLTHPPGMKKSPFKELAVNAK